MFYNKKNEWKYIPVETADEVISCKNVVECKSLENWNRWLKIREQQHKYLGLMVYRSSTSLLMNKSDEFRSKVECKWMIDLAQKLKINNNYTRDFPYSVSREINNFISIYIPDVIYSEKGLSNLKKDPRKDLEMQKSNLLLSNQLYKLKSLRPVKSPEKLVIVGKNIDKKIENYKGIIPTIVVNSECKNVECNDNELIAIRINDILVKLLKYNVKKCEIIELNTKSIYTTKIKEECWDEIFIENCSQISIQYKWEKDKWNTSKYSYISKEQPIMVFYFDTRTSILGPGQIKRLPVLFRSNIIGPYREMWLFQVDILGNKDTIAQIKIPLQGCALPNDDTKQVIIKIQKALLFEKIKSLCGKLTNKIIQNVFPEIKSSLIDKYYYHDNKMKHLYRILQSKKSLSIDELLYQCMQLDKSFREKFLDLISQTAVILLKKEIIFNYGQMTQRELNAHKAIYVAMDCIDLILSTYEPDYNEACRNFNNDLMDQNPYNLKIQSNEEEDKDKDISVDYTIEQLNSNYGIIREEWLEIIKPMIHKRLECSIEIIADYDLRFPECKHSNIL